MLYLTFKWLHILAIISWMAGVLYLYRIFINYVDNQEKGESVKEVLTLMAFRLYKVITVPAMAASYIFGFAMIFFAPSLASGGWFHIKLLMVLGLTASTLYGGMLQKRMASHGAAGLPTSRNLRILNEVPTLFMFIIVAMVIFKPWA